MMAVTPTRNFHQHFSIISYRAWRKFVKQKL